MSASAFPPATTELSSLTPGVLQSHSQYRPCHIRLPGDEHRLAAILVNGKYYGLVKVVRDFQQALAIRDRLTSKGNETFITPIAKGNAIWTLEVNARLDSPTSVHSSDLSKQVNSSTCKILSSHSQIQICRIRVPDLNEPLKAILVDSNYYGLFKVVDNRQQALELAAKLGLRGDETVITKTTQGDAVWVLEADATQI
jgi:hypothetical protein